LSSKHKLVPRLLGITKESIVRVDERTKEVNVCQIELQLCLQFQF